MIYKAKVAVGSTIYDMDAVKHEGGVWLVPLWIEEERGSYMKPARMLRVDLSPQFQVLTGGSKLGDFIVGRPIPYEALHGEPTEDQIKEYSILNQPDLLVRKPEAR